jgi:hypothetical protein
VNSLALTDNALECQWESADGRSKTAEIVLPWSKVMDVLGEIHGSSLGHLGIGKISKKSDGGTTGHM